MTTLIILTIFSASGQVKYALVDFYRGDYCDKKNPQEFVGHSVKIWDNGGIYPDFNEGTIFDWAPDTIKQKCGENIWDDFYPQTGDTGQIVFVSDYLDKMVVTAKYIYILKTKGHYMAIGCGYITDIDRLDNDAQWKEWTVQDSIERIEYAGDCEFKTFGINDCWNRAGICNIDKMCETFACDLKNNEVDTILLSKYIYDNGSLPSEKSFVLWYDNGQGYLKSFFNNEKHKPKEGNQITYDWKEVLEHYSKNRLDTVTTNPQPKYWQSHDMGFLLQLYLPDQFFCQRLSDYMVQADKKHIKSKWWTMIADRMKKIKK